MTATDAQRALLTSLLEAHPRLFEADDLVARHADLRDADDALYELLEDGLATRLGDLVGASRAAVRFEALRTPQP